MSSDEYKTIREKIGTQKAVADLLGVTRETIAHRETGREITTEAEFALRWLQHAIAQGVEGLALELATNDVMLDTLD